MLANFGAFINIDHEYWYRTSQWCYDAAIEI